MKTVIWVVGEKKEEKLISLLKGKETRILLFGLLPAKESEEEGKEHKLWHSLFSLKEELSSEGFSVSIATERGGPSSLLEVANALNAEMVFLPKEIFLLLGPLENDDFLNQISCPLLLY